ncbi:glycosyltransferase family 4 protein [Porphyrobacter sp. ULC335]|uniref:glycosyltransferase family 4 protein n=1 Tax=Porphyrobacter sp. ULC335 TaxID=2854260 RepID=UPI00221ED974|nr:glycosyltransferase family 1 protein [Porphyrobacter sp. ULC335]UYV14521.1 glycosyltransferase family 4 protein [Porphyrobacter sp. ULC335]
MIEGGGMGRRTICIDCRYIGPRPSGIAETVRALVDFVPELAPDLDFLLLRSPAHRGALSKAVNVREVVVPSAANGPATMWWLPRVVDLSAVSLFHATFNIMPAGLKAPCVTTIHDLMWLTEPQLCSARLAGRAQALFHGHGIRRALRKSAAIVTVSEASRREIIAHSPPAARQTFVTMSGVSPEFRPVPRNILRLAELGVRPDRRFVLTVGQYAPYKNHEGALRAFACAFADRPEIDLVLVQRMGARGERLLRLAKELGIRGRVRLLQPVSRADLVQLYSSASALLHPSFCEGFGNPLAEAMACGCPVVTSNVSAMPEVTGGAALLAPPDDFPKLAEALRKAVDDKAQAAAMREAGLARAATLNWRSFAADTLAVYRGVLAS